MPRYEYDCGRCGPFTETVGLAAYRDPQPCPTCALPAPRRLLTAPAMQASGMDRATRAGLRYGGQTHAAGCGCCRPAAPRIGT